MTWRRIFSLKKSVLAKVAAGLVTAFLLAGAGIYMGVYNVSALTGHTKPVYELLEYVRVRAVQVRTPEKVPELAQFDWRDTGVRLYTRHCQQCHGAPGIAPEPFALGMMPPPSAIVRVGRQRSAGELYWVVKNGIKMSGMPAWKYRLTEAETWTLVALMKKLPTLTVPQYAALQATAGAAPALAQPAQAIGRDTQGDDKGLLDGRVLLQQYNCSSCHMITEIPSAKHDVGPSLVGITRQSFLVGKLEMNRQNLIRWLMHPQQIKPGSAMPDLDVSRAHAAAMVEYLYRVDASD